ncbi:hypothetical protein PINS_up014833 [Pythium insidiosum]|nr:hypothetical protein PINS_up014833 [Pythium insidiosum]
MARRCQQHTRSAIFDRKWRPWKSGSRRSSRNGCRRFPMKNVLVSACHAAQQKWTTMQVERVNAKLRDQLTQQQFVFASLQSAILQAPLQSRCQEMWDAVHLDTVLRDEQTDRRVEQLQTHLRKGLELVPGAIERFTSHVTSSPSPYSQVDVTGGADCTTVGSVVVLEFPQVTLIELFKAVLTYYATMPDELQHYTATETDVQLLNSLGNLSQYARVRFTSEVFPTTVNTAFTAAIVDGIAVFHSDTIDQDAMFPASSERGHSAHRRDSHDDHTRDGRLHRQDQDGAASDTAAPVQPPAPRRSHPTRPQAETSVS